jgi:hypothetical protein
VDCKKILRREYEIMYVPSSLCLIATSRFRQLVNETESVESLASRLVADEPVLDNSWLLH